MPDVFVEDSSRAAHLASATHQGHHITLSRKLQATFTAAETDFVLAYHLACMKRRGGGNWERMKGLVFLPLLAPLTLVLLLKGSTGAYSASSFILSPWFFPAFLAFPFVGVVLLVATLIGSSNRQAKQDADADREALEATEDLAAAVSALDKLSADAAFSPEAQLTTQFGGSLVSGGLTGKSGKNTAQLEAGRLLLRRLALQKTAQTLRFAPAPGARPEPADLSPFSSSSKAEQAE